MIQTKNLTRTFKNGDVVTEVLKGIDFAARDGEFVSIMGRSGAGKSTLLYQGKGKREAYKISQEALTRAGLGKRLGNLSSQLSGGEQQRVAIVRAIAHRPKVLFADEPTAHLDHESSKVIMDIFLELHREGQTIIMVTHEQPYAKLADRIVHLDDGKIVSTTGNTK